jgi:hypothetical protein
MNNILQVGKTIEVDGITYQAFKTDPKKDKCHGCHFSYIFGGRSLCDYPKDKKHVCGKGIVLKQVV